MKFERPVGIIRIIARLNIGGPAWQVSVLTRGLNDHDFVTKLVTGNVDDGEGDFVALRDPELPHQVVTGLGRTIRPLDDIRAFFLLFRIIRRERPLIVHTHTAKAGVLGRLAAILARAPIRVHTFHGHLLHGYFSPLKTRLVVIAERLLARYTTHLVAVGEQVRDDLIAAGIGRIDRFTIIPPGVDLGSVSATKSADSIRQLHSIPDGRSVVLFVGRLTRVKRVDRLINAARLVLSDHPATVFIVCGDGELRSELESSVTDLADAIRFVGWQADVTSFYPIADVVVLTSDNEGMPVGLIEASLAGRTCVTTDVGSAREVVIHGSTGFVVEPEVRPIAEAILTLLDDADLRHRFEQAARIWASERFSSARLVDDHRRLYERLLAQN